MSTMSVSYGNSHTADGICLFGHLSFFYFQYFFSPWVIDATIPIAKISPPSSPARRCRAAIHPRRRIVHWRPHLNGQQGAHYFPFLASLCHRGTRVWSDRRGNVLPPTCLNNRSDQSPAVCTYLHGTCNWVLPHFCNIKVE